MELEGKNELKKQEEWAYRGGKRIQRSPQEEAKTGLEREEEEKYV